jgi:hypothetical protein
MHFKIRGAYAKHYSREEMGTICSFLSRIHLSYTTEIVCHCSLLQSSNSAFDAVCRKCIYKKFNDEEVESCPKCGIDLGCTPVEKLRYTYAYDYPLCVDADVKLNITVCLCFQFSP